MNTYVHPVALPSDYLDLEKVMTIEEAAWMYKVHPDTLLYWVRFGHIAAIKEHGQWFVSLTSIRRLFPDREHWQRRDVPAYEIFNIKPGYLSPRRESLRPARSRSRAAVTQSAAHKRQNDPFDKKQ